MYQTSIGDHSVIEAAILEYNETVQFVQGASTWIIVISFNFIDTIILLRRKFLYSIISEVHLVFYPEIKAVWESVVDDFNKRQFIWTFHRLFSQDYHESPVRLEILLLIFWLVAKHASVNQQIVLSAKTCFKRLNS